MIHIFQKTRLLIMCHCTYLHWNKEKKILSEKIPCCVEQGCLYVCFSMITMCLKIQNTFYSLCMILFIINWISKEGTSRSSWTGESRVFCRLFPHDFQNAPTLYLSGEASHCKWLSLSVLSSRRSHSLPDTSDSFQCFLPPSLVAPLFPASLYFSLLHKRTATVDGALGAERPGASARDEW